MLISSFYPGILKIQTLPNPTKPQLTLFLAQLERFHLYPPLFASSKSAESRLFFVVEEIFRSARFCVFLVAARNLPHRQHLEVCMVSITL